MTRSLTALLTITAAGMVVAVSPAAAADPTVLHVSQIDQQDIAPLPGSVPDTLVEPDVDVSRTNPDWARRLFTA